MLEEKITLFEETLKQAASERRMIQDVLEGDKKRITTFIEEESADARKEAEKFLKEIMNGSAGVRKYGKSSKAIIQEAWAEAIPEFFEREQAELNERVKIRLLECLTPHEDRLDQLVETLRRTAADLFQVPYRPLRQNESLEIKRKPYWVLNSWNTDALPMLKSSEQRLEELARRNVENIRWSMLQNLNISFARFASRIKERLTETVAATKGAMEAARVRRSGTGGSVEAEVASKGKLVGSLEELKSDLIALQSDLP